MEVKQDSLAKTQKNCFTPKKTIHIYIYIFLYMWISEPTQYNWNNLTDLIKL